MLETGLGSDIDGTIALLVTVLFLGIRHGFDWDHIAAITDITSTAIATDSHAAGSRLPADAHLAPRAFAVEGDASAAALMTPPVMYGAAATGAAAWTRSSRWLPPARPFTLGTLYALGHATVVAILGLMAYLLGAALPEWIDPVMGRVVGVTLLALGAWLLLSAVRSARYGHAFHLRSRWMLVLDGSRALYDRVLGRHATYGHTDRPRSYGARTAFGVGMIHGVGAETATQILLITALAGAAGTQLGIPLMVAFIVGLVLGNTVIVAISTSGLSMHVTRPGLALTVGVVAGLASFALGLVFVLGWEAGLPDVTGMLGASLGV